MMFAVEKEMNIPARKGHTGLIAYFREAVMNGLRPDETAVRFVVTQSDDTLYHFEIGIASGIDKISNFIRDQSWRGKMYRLLRRYDFLRKTCLKNRTD